jgi:exodeoxyribonuclease-5
VRCETTFSQRSAVYSAADVRRGRVALSDDQARVFERAVDWECRRRSSLLTIGGLAGSGKSTVVAELARVWEYSFVAFCAYTGKAANVLRQKIRAAGAESPWHTVGTIHSLIYEPVEDPETGVVVEWVRRQELGVELIVVDEASMVSTEVLRDLQSFGVSVLAVGDHGQLPPVGGEGVLVRDPDLKLEKIHRQAEGSAIIRLAHAVRVSGDLPHDLRDGGGVRVVSVPEALRLLADLYARDEDVGVVTYTNRSRQRFNAMAREVKYGARAHASALLEGDQVVCLRNTERVLFNGMRGVVEGVPRDATFWWRGRFYFPDDALEVDGCALKSQFGRERTYGSWEEVEGDNPGLRVRAWGDVGLLFDYGYAVTCHKAQSASYRHTFVLYEKLSRCTTDEWCRWIYTACTRASEQLYIVVP